MSAIKQCLQCGVSKKLDDFYDHPETASKKMNTCKMCCRARSEENYQKNRKQKNKNSNDYRLSNPDKNKNACKRYRNRPENKIKRKLRDLGFAADKIEDFLKNCPPLSDYLGSWTIDFTGKVKKNHE